MQVNELLDLTRWIIDKIADKGLVEKYQQLLSVLQQNARSNQPKQPFDQQKQSLIEALTAVPLDELSTGQIDILKELDISQNVGADGVSQIEDVLFKNAIDVASAAQRVERSVTQLNQGIEWSRQQRDLLSKVVTVDAVAETEGKVLLRVRFTGDAAVNNLTDLKDWSKTWWEIGRGIAIAHGQSPEAISVVGASKGSIIVALLTVGEIAATVSGIILSALKVAEKYYDIRRKAQEVRALELSNDKAEKALEAEAATYKATGIDEIVKATIAELKVEQGDQANELTSSVKKLVDFITKGGEVDFVMPTDDKGNGDSDNDGGRPERVELRVRFQEVRRLEREVRQLEHHET